MTYLIRLSTLRLWTAAHNPPDFYTLNLYLKAVYYTNSTFRVNLQSQKEL